MEATGPRTRRRVLVIVQGQLGNQPTGPEIRGLEIARAFAVTHAVTIAASVPEPTTREGIPVVDRSRRRLISELHRHDVVVAPLLPPYLMSVLATRRCLRVADLYDPVDLEMGMLGHDWRAERAVAQQRSLRRMQLRHADVVLCANERQRERAVNDLLTLRRLGPPPRFVKVPMGLPSPPAATTERPLRRRFGLDDRDRVILWWGTVWRWLDAETAISAMKILVERVPRARLVITAGRPPNRATDALNTTEQARAFARELGVLDRNVFFYDDWVPFDERHHHLADADIGLTLHGATPEASLAARARYMDYIWGTVPCVLAEGDELADEMSAAGAARLVAARQPAATAAAIEALLSDEHALATARDACRALALQYSWGSLVKPLIEEAQRQEPGQASRRRLAQVSAESGRFYARRLADKVLRLP